MNQLNKISLVAHRGSCGGNIPCNSLQAFQMALNFGADIIELDVEKSKDQVLYIQHPGMEYVHLGLDGSIADYDSKEVDQMLKLNEDHTPTAYPIVRFEEALTFLKGKCKINIDKFWMNPGLIIETVRKLHMEDQVLIKCDCKPEYLDNVRRYAPDIPFLGIIRETDEISGMLQADPKINFVGAEVIFRKDDAEVASPAFIDKMHRMCKILWANAIVYNYQRPLTGGHCDDISVTEDPEKGWGWLADRGFDLIQTDFVYQCRDFLQKTGRL